MAPPDAPFARALYPPSHDKGPVKPYPDVEAVKRAISRAGYWPWQEFDEDYNEKFAMEGVKKFQQENGLSATGNYGEPTHTRLLDTRRKGSKTEWAFDKTAIHMMEEADREINMKPENKALTKARAMLAFCRLFDGPYIYGGQHDRTFTNDDVHDGFDCSSSTSFVLWKFNLMNSNMAQVSSWFSSWGLAGRGKYVTIHSAWDHVWMEFSLPEGWYRFDTSPYGQYGHGPRVRNLRRPDSRFVHRHPANM